MGTDLTTTPLSTLRIRSEALFDGFLTLAELPSSETTLADMHNVADEFNGILAEVEHRVAAGRTFAPPDKA